MNLDTARATLAEDTVVACRNELFGYAPVEWNGLMLRQMTIDALDANVELGVVAGADLESFEATLEDSNNLTSYGQV